MRTEEGAKKILRRARELVERGWCQGAYARGAEGQVVDKYGPAARSFCVLGAVDRASERYHYEARDVALRVLGTVMKELTGARTPGYYNDAYGRTQEDIVTLLKKAEERVDE